MSNENITKESYNFAIIAVGTNDITALDTIDRPVAAAYQEASKQSQTLLRIAQNLVHENDMDVFLVERPPRYDLKNIDPTSLKQKLSKHANRTLFSTVAENPRICIVDQSNLSRSSGKQRWEIYEENGVNLTAEGVKIFDDNIIECIADCYDYIKDESGSVTHNSFDDTFESGESK